MLDLTNKQKEVLEYIIVKCIAEYRTPTYREICEEFDIKSTNCVSDYIRALRRKGWLDKDADGKSQPIKLTKKAIDYYCLDNEITELRLCMLELRKLLERYPIGFDLNGCNAYSGGEKVVKVVLDKINKLNLEVVDAEDTSRSE